MLYSYRLHPEAQVEYENSATWYADRNLKSAVGFVDAVERAFRIICDNPRLFRNRYKDFYEYNLKNVLLP